jgi:hypothetical protein
VPGPNTSRVVGLPRPSQVQLPVQSGQTQAPAGGPTQGHITQRGNTVIEPRGRPGGLGRPGSALPLTIVLSAAQLYSCIQRGLSPQQCVDEIAAGLVTGLAAGGVGYLIAGAVGVAGATGAVLGTVAFSAGATVAIAGVAMYELWRAWAAENEAATSDVVAKLQSFIRDAKGMSLRRAELEQSAQTIIDLMADLKTKRDAGVEIGNQLRLKEAGLEAVRKTCLE